MLLPRRFLFLAFTALAAAPAFAADVTLGGKTELWYDDNVLGTETDEISDGELLITPNLEISERWGTVEAQLNLKPNYELFFDQKGLRGFNYQGDGALSWSPTPRTRFELNDTFWRYRSLRLLSTAANPGSTPAEFGARDRFTRNVAQISASHRLTPIDTLQFSGNFMLWDFSDVSRFDQKTFAAAANYQHYLSEAVSIGAGASYSRVRVEQFRATPRRDTDYVNLSLIANYQPMDTFFVRLTVGPTYVRQPRISEPSLVRGQLYRFSGNDILIGLIPSTCPTLSTGEFFDGAGCNLFGIDPVAQSFIYSLLAQRALDPVPFVGGLPKRDDFTYFADVSLERKWEAASLAIAYRRDEGSNSVAGYSTVADTFELRGSLRPLRDLNLSAAVVWEDRKESQNSNRFVTILDTLPAAGPLPAITNLVPVALRAVGAGNATANVESLSAYVNGAYRLTAHTDLTAAISWRDQAARGSSFTNDYERFLVMLGVSVELEPLRW